MPMEASEIRNYIDSHGLKHTWVAKSLGISKSYLSLILSGTRVAPAWFEGKITKLLNIKGEEPYGENIEL